MIPKSEHSRLIDGLMLQSAINGDSALAELIAKECSVCEYASGDVIIEIGDHTDDLYFILRGRVEILVYDTFVAQRVAGQHVGEMAAIDPRVDRNATVKAIEDCEVAVLNEQALGRIAQLKPEIWRNIARELVQRLRESPGNSSINNCTEESYWFQMKRHLFYLFLVIFASTAIITLLGIAEIVSINDFYLKGLYTTLLVELIGTVIGLFKTARFFKVAKNDRS